jgi:hypothetical protein
MCSHTGATGADVVEAGWKTSRLKRWIAAIIVLACSAGPVTAEDQDMPVGALIQEAIGIGYDRLGLMEYCAAHGSASADDVANVRKVAEGIAHGFSVGAAARAQEAVGRQGTIIGQQAIGLLDASNPARPEIVPAGKTMSLADNARAQGTTERVLCGQMAAQVAPLPR